MIHKQLITYLLLPLADMKFRQTVMVLCINYNRCRYHKKYDNMLVQTTVYNHGTIDHILAEININHNRSFASAGPMLWNSLADDITSASSLTSVSAKTKKHIYLHSRVVTLLCSLFVVVLAMVVLAVIYLGHLKKCHVL